MNSEIRYRIDKNDIVTATNREWSVAAAANGLDTDNVIGKPLWDFVVGHDTQYLYQLILQEVRKSARPFRFPVRCDSPEVRRFTEMTIQQVDSGEVEFSHRTIREEARPVPYPPGQASADSQKIVTVCSWCLRVKVGEDQWAEIEEAGRTLGLLEGNHTPRFSHSICPDCFQAVKRQIADSEEIES